MLSKDVLISKIKEGINSFYKQKEVIIPTELVGVSATQHEIAVAHVVANNVKDITVKSYACASADSNATKQEFLTKYVMEYHLDGLPTSYVLPLSTYNLSMIETPKATPQEFKAALQAAVEEFITYPVEEAIVDAFQLPLKRVSDNKKVMYAASIQAKLIPSIEELINGSGLLLQYVDIQELCLRNLAFLHPENANGSLFVRFSAEGGQIVLLQKETIFATRQIDVPLTQLIAGKVADNSVALEYNEEELLDTLSLDLQRSIDFCSNVFRDSPARSAIIAPAVVDVDKIYNYLKQHLGLPVFKLELAEVMKFQQEDSDNKQAKCLFAIAACLRHLLEQSGSDTEH